MFNMIKTAAVAATIAAGVFAAAPAQADSLNIKFKDGNFGFGLHVGNGYGPNYAYGPNYGYGGYGPKCKPWKAVNKAKWMGVKKAHVIDVDWNRIVVKGKKFGGPVKVVFGKAPHCPVKAIY